MCCEHEYLNEIIELGSNMIAIGIDVSKLKLDIFHAGKSEEILNTEKCIKKFGKSLKDKDCRIVLESTGKYHRLTHKILVEMGFTVMVINPFQSRHFAKSMNVICKTDRVDAKILAKYAEVMEYNPTMVATEQETQMQGLSRHLEDLKQTKLELTGRLDGAECHFIVKSLKRTIKTIEKEIADAEAELDKAVGNDKELTTKCELLESIPGIGHKTAVFLVCNLRELGNINKNKIAALSGLAPRNNDSGSFSGKRYVRGGRRDVRAWLYMPILGAATQHNKRLKSFYERLVIAGKNKKAALVACMRKLIVWANSVLATGKKWEECHA